MTKVQRLAGLLVGGTVCAEAAKWDWLEGTEERNDGATRDYYNRAAGLAWKRQGGDWVDAAGTMYGEEAFGTVVVTRGDAGGEVSIEVKELVNRWVRGELVNQGLMLRVMGGGDGLVELASREGEAARRPSLSAGAGRAFETAADTYLEPSTYRCVGGTAAKLKAGRGAVALARWGVSGLEAPVESAVLKLGVERVFGSGEVRLGVFAVAAGEGEAVVESRPGIAARYPGDRGIAEDPRVWFATGFEESDWQDGWSHVGQAGSVDVVGADVARRFEPLAGRAMRVRMREGQNGALNTLYKFGEKIGEEPEEVYFRYYLRFGDDWNQTVAGGKMPGISGTYGVAGWGGRPSSGADGWSARGQFFKTVPAGNPLEGLHPIGTYCYHADMKGRYGESLLWSKGYAGFLEKNRWVCVEQSVRMNTPGEKDGVIRGWVDGVRAFERRGLRFRTTPRLKIEQVWMNVYHGGKAAAPYDQHLFIDHVVVAREYIGPFAPLPPTSR